ncbi:MAG: methyltransferase domain-containing protein [Rubrivivax sp.]|nr:methyltransferase domain-containing protein [Rubrivivax sp.]
MNTTTGAAAMRAAHTALQTAADTAANNAAHTARSTTVARQWDAAAQSWHDSRVPIRAWLQQATAALLNAAAIAPGMRVLDVAAGAGDQTLDIARRVGLQSHVTATDVSPHMLVLAAEALREAGLHNVDCLPSDAQALPLAGAGYDAAVCRPALMLCPQPALALRCIHAALRPGARLSLLVFDGPAGNPCIAALARMVQRHAPPPAATPAALPADPYRPGSLLSLGRPGLLLQLLQGSGFDDIRIEAIEAPFELPSAHDYVQFLRNAAAPVMALLQPLPAAVQRAAWQEISAELSAFQTADGWRGPNRLLLASGRAAAPQA